MKRLLVSILAVLYLVSASGATVHLHYCMGKLIGASLVDSGRDTHDCSHCGMVKKSSGGCCKDEHMLVKTDHEHQGAKLSLDLEPLLALVPADLPFALPGAAALYSNEITPLPDICLRWRCRPLFLLFQDFRI